MPTLRHAATLLCAATLFGCSAESTSEVLAPDAVAPRLDAFGASSGPSASGHANFINAAGQLVQRTFHARQKEDGLVEGNFVQHNTVLGLVIKGDIDCLLLLGLNQARMSGPIREHTDPTFIGTTAIFRVADNGEGSNDPPDQISGLFTPGAGSTLDCKTFVNPFFTPIQSGNIQVKP
jgi:hypothetical protein